MGSSKRKKKRKPPVARAVDDRPLLSAPKDVPWSKRSDRHQMVALTMASLAAGIFLILNLDRSMHPMTRNQRIAVTSHHGWPAVYLERRATNPPLLFINRRIYPWPWPAVNNEARTWNLRNLGLDLVIGISTAGISFLAVNQFVQRYDRWKRANLSK